MVAVLTAVFHDSMPGQTALYGAPQIGECLGRHVGMAHQVVRTADQLLTAESAERYKIVIGMRNDAPEVGL